MDELAIEQFRKLLRIRTVTLENPDYPAIESFLKATAADIGLQFKRYDSYRSEPDDLRPIFALTLPGRSPNLPPLILNSHIDVVPVYPDKWTHDPFAADMTPDGLIYARGSQDMKCVSVQYLEALRRILKAHQGNEPPFLRTIHAFFVPDEEQSGYAFCKFIKTSAFKALLEPSGGQAFALDEGIASTGPDFRIFYAERTKCSTVFSITGTSGHGSQFLPSTVGEKLRRFLDFVYDYRDSELKRKNAGAKEGDVTVANLTIIHGGLVDNIVPDNVQVTIDVRHQASRSVPEIKTMMEEWARAAGEGVSIVQFDRLCSPEPSTRITPTVTEACHSDSLADRLYGTVLYTLHAHGFQTRSDVFPAATDGRHLREVGIPVVGFSPIRNSPVLLHMHDECIHRDVFLEGIAVYIPLITTLANLEP